MVKPIPEGYQSVIPQLSVDGAVEAIEFYKKAFGAEELGRAMHPSGTKVWHASLRIGNAVFFVNDIFPEMDPTPSKTTLWIYSENVEALWKRATGAGNLRVVLPIQDQFWGDRMGAVVDRWGISWMLAQRMKELTPEQLKKAEQEFIARSEQ